MVAKKQPLSDFAVCVPLIPQELPEALLSHEWWDREALPSRIEDESMFDLVYVFPEGKCEEFEEAVKIPFKSIGWGGSLPKSGLPMPNWSLRKISISVNRMPAR